MSKKNKNGQSGIVYSTDPDFSFEQDPEPVNTPDPSRQRLRVALDSKQRAGKTVTLVTGFEGDVKDIESLGKELKALCGTGGAVKEGKIIIQGDHREKVIQWLIKKGYKDTKRSGG
jgi:translation initiation factor 1